MSNNFWVISAPTLPTAKALESPGIETWRVWRIPRPFASALVLSRSRKTTQQLEWICGYGDCELHDRHMILIKLRMVRFFSDHGCFHCPLGSSCHQLTTACLAIAWSSTTSKGNNPNVSKCPIDSSLVPKNETRTTECTKSEEILPAGLGWTASPQSHTD